MSLCPGTCATELLMTERYGIQIDYCPKCRGIWLDRGELDKIIERVEADVLARSGSGQGLQDAAPPIPSHPGPARPQNPQVIVVKGRDDDDDDDRYYKRHKKKRGGWLGDIFDFD